MRNSGQMTIGKARPTLFWPTFLPFPLQGKSARRNFRPAVMVPVSQQNLQPEKLSDLYTIRIRLQIYRISIMWHHVRQTGKGRNCWTVFFNLRFFCVSYRSWVFMNQQTLMNQPIGRLISQIECIFSTISLMTSVCQTVIVKHEVHESSSVWIMDYPSY